MKKIFCLLVLIVSISWNAGAQTKTAKIQGTVTDVNGKVVESATISLMRKADSAVVKYAIADKNGRYEFENLTVGEYLLKVSAVGHTTFYTENITIDDLNATLSVKKVQLVPQTKDLSTVTVTAKKPFIEQKIDRTVINVEASVTNAGSTALDVLERSPGITIDKDGNISLKGKQGVMVMMDGRPTYLSAAELTNYLRNLPATAIEQIEIMTNPSAKYDAAGNSGIINIKTKKNKQKGFNGNLSLNYGQGRYWKSNNSINMNYRTGKVNVFANAGASQWNGFQKLDIHRKFLDPTSKNVKAIFDQTSNMNNTSNYYNLKLGADYYLSKNTTLGVVTSGFYNPEQFSSRNLSFLKDNAGHIDSIAYAQSKNTNLWQNGSVNFNVRHQFDSAGRELTADADYITYQADNSQTYSSTSFDPEWLKKGIEQLRGDLPVAIDIYSAKVDYTHPLGKETKLEAGIKSSYVETDNAANYFTVGNVETPDYNKTNHFLYKENINAAYLNFNRQFNKFGVQAGLRYEHTQYNGKQYGNPTRQDSAFERGYGNLFPTLFVSYKADKNNQWAMSFGRRVNRPAYQDLNPFMFFLDNYTYGSGNPFLRPQYSNNVELTHTFKSFLTTTLNYGRTKDMMNETFEQARNLNGSNEYATIVRKGNIGERNTAGIAISAQVPIAKWWSSNIYANYNYNKFSGLLYGEYIDIEATNLTMNINNQLKFNKGWSAELSGWYRTKGIEGQILIQPMGAASAGVSKQILKQQGSLKLSVRDMFYTQFPKGDINFQNTRAHFENRRDSRVLNLAFSYRFGKPIKDQRQRKNGGVDEQNRVKVGGGN
jgi:outer membrane receptor protein involved in Fe transport